MPDDKTVYDTEFIVHEMNIHPMHLLGTPYFDISGDSEEVIASMERALDEEGYIHHREGGKLFITGQYQKDTDNNEASE